ncbi:hypothetical protein [Halobacteriovorax sp. HLS]|uniref:hypothetical protein n=1 Tax=Halobacteriovorax sp. HLS TaxID=2234000 RepID=UPI000FDA6EA6|nr:hypothetical protein [Halobacteriovorax sp. HLS]
MLKRSFIILVFMSVVTTSAFGNQNVKVVKESEMTLQDVVSRVSYVSGQKYISSIDLSKKILSINLEITKENSDTVLTSFLHENGLTRVEESEGLFKIISVNEISNTVLKSYVADKKLNPKLPRTYDFYLLKYSIANREQIKDLAKKVEPYLSSNGALLYANIAGEIIVRDNAHNLSKIYRVLKRAEIQLEQKALSLNDRENEQHVLQENGERES